MARKHVFEKKLLFSIEETAELLGIGRSTTYELIRVGSLPSVQIGRRRLVPREALRKWVQENTEGGTFLPLPDADGA